MLTKKYYKNIANVLGKILDRINTEEEEKIFNKTVYDLADYFAKDNPKFNKEKFLNEVYSGVRYDNS